jgi:thiamine pyrophosphate-dependent acetolactate synthase large subunit-like protein
MSKAKTRSAKAAPSKAVAAKRVKTEDIERPVPSGANAPGYGSDVIAETLRSLDIPYVSLNPGSSYRGLHDSLVNYLGNRTPQMILCQHEGTAIAVAHGYAKVMDRAMVAAVHSNVGLMQATMGIYNAWCDRKPMIVLGATGPVDAAKRRSIDWLHTSRDQGALIRDFIKWDDQPASPAAAREAILRAAWLTNTEPCAPVYLNFDAELQEAPLKEQLPPIDVTRYLNETRTAAPASQIRAAAKLLKAAKNPVIFSGRATRSMDAWNARIALAEMLNARVVTDLNSGASFPTDHPLYAGAPRTKSADTVGAMKSADVILSLDWPDLVGALKTGGVTNAKIIHVSIDHTVHNGWSMDHQSRPPVDLYLAGSPEIVLQDLIEALGGAAKKKPMARNPAAKPEAPPASGPIENEHIARAIRLALGGRPATLAYTPISWGDRWWPALHPLDYTGRSGGGGIGAGPGISVGVALALKGSGRIPVGVCGDGDFIMGNNAVWTAAHYRIPVLFVVANNRSYFNDEVHQERVARVRKRPVENRWIGQRIDDPAIDIAGLARAQGAAGFGPVSTADELARALGEAVGIVENGGVAIIDVRTGTGYLDHA